MLGAIAGSFIATWTQRWGEDRAIGGRSVCDDCGRILTPLELIPLASFALQRGQCRACGAAIGWRQFSVELAAAAIGGVALFLLPDWHGLALAWFGWLLIALILFDVEHLWLPDVATGLLAASGLAFGLADWQNRVIGTIAGFVALEAVRRAYRAVRNREGMGGGDPKLLGAIGAWFGWAMLPFVLLGASVIGLVLLAARGARGGEVSATLALPFGALMAAAALFLGFASAWVGLPTQ